MTGQGGDFGELWEWGPADTVSVGLRSPGNGENKAELDQGVQGEGGYEGLITKT